MRIVAGKYGGRKLRVPNGYDVRPTSDKVRGAIFNALTSRGAVEGAAVLDVFCGTGALGLEALSRGASSCTFADKSRRSLNLAKQNADDLGAEENSEFILKDAVKLGTRPDGLSAANLIFLDPPYEQDLILTALEALINGSWLADAAMIVIESEKSFSVKLPSVFQIEDERVYKDTKITFASYMQESYLM